MTDVGAESGNGTTSNLREPRQSTMEHLPRGEEAAAIIPYTGDGRASSLWRTAKGFCRIATTLMFDLKTTGARNVPLRGGVLLVSNHQSYLDPVLIGVAVRRPLSYLAKSELFRNRYLGGLFRWLNAFPVKQGTGDVGAVRETITRLQQGHALNIFPEGSRTRDGQMLPLEKGVGLIVRKAGVPVVPLVIDGSYRAWPKGRKLFRSAPIRIRIGPPMQLSHLRGEEVVRRIDATLRQMFQALREETAAEEPR